MAFGDLEVHAEAACARSWSREVLFGAIVGAFIAFEPVQEGGTYLMAFGDPEVQAEAACACAIVQDRKMKVLSHSI